MLMHIMHCNRNRNVSMYHGDIFAIWPTLTPCKSLDSLNVHFQFPLFPKFCSAAHYSGTNVLSV